MSKDRSSLKSVMGKDSSYDKREQLIYVRIDLKLEHDLKLINSGRCHDQCGSHSIFRYISFVE